MAGSTAPMRLRLLLLAVAVATVVGVWPRAATAQTVELTSPTPERPTVPATTEEVIWINFKSCAAPEDNLRFHVTVQNATEGQKLEVWTGDKDRNCSANEERQDPNPVCWRVFQQVESLNGTHSIDIFARDVVAGLADETLRGPRSQQGMGTCAHCFSSTAKATVRLNFMLVAQDGTRADNDTSNIRQSDEIEVDVKGPSAPSSVTAGIGENRVVLKWQASESEDVERYEFFCDAGDGATADAGQTCVDPMTATGTGGAGTGGAGTGGAPASNPECPSSVLIPGQLPTGTPCGTARGAAEGTTDANLENGRTYTVGVAAVDELGNVGPLSNIDCATPQPVVDFFEAYQRAGGKGGGGFCAVSRPGAPLTIGWLFLLAGLAWIRRRGR